MANLDMSGAFALPHFFPSCTVHVYTCTCKLGHDCYSRMIDLCVLNGLQITRLCLYLRSHVIMCPFMAIMLPSLSPRPNLYYTRRMQRIEPIIMCTLIAHHWHVHVYMYVNSTNCILCACMRV